jgi:hypothetical protein
MLYPRRFAILSFLLCASLLCVGVVHGIWTDRWLAPDDEQVVQELEKLPLRLGNWQGETLASNSANEAIPESRRNLVRRYVNRADGSVADILLGRGRPGPMLMYHTPPECYPAAGFEMVSPPKRFLSQSEEAGKPDEFWVATFKKTKGADLTTVRVYWSWSATGQWLASESPRMTFARYPLIYKMYVVQNIPHENVDVIESPVHDLMKKMTKATRETFFSSARP